MAIPSIKGTAFQSAHDDVTRLVACGRIRRTELEVRLRPGDLRILDEKVAAAAWYPIDVYARLIELLVDAEAAGRPEEYLLERGARAAERLSAAGIYQQLQASIDQLGPRIGKFIVTLSGAMYNFGRWSFEAGTGAGDFRIRVEDAAAYPEVSRFATQGFIEFVATRTVGRPVRLTSERPAPDRIVFTARSPA